MSPLLVLAAAVAAFFASAGCNAQVADPPAQAFRFAQREIHHLAPGETLWVSLGYELAEPILIESWTAEADPGLEVELLGLASCAEGCVAASKSESELPLLVRSLRDREAPIDLPASSGGLGHVIVFQVSRASDFPIGDQCLKVHRLKFQAAGAMGVAHWDAADEWIIAISPVEGENCG